MKTFFIIFSFIVLSICGAQLRADPDSKALIEINHLLNYVKSSKVVFIRNGKEYSASDAHDHLGKKFDHFKKHILTAEQFIEKCATKSEISGKEYQIKIDEKTKYSSADFLTTELKKFREPKKATEDVNNNVNKSEPQK